MITWLVVGLTSTKVYSDDIEMISYLILSLSD